MCTQLLYILSATYYAFMSHLLKGIELSLEKQLGKNGIDQIFLYILRLTKDFSLFASFSSYQSPMIRKTWGTIYKRGSPGAPTVKAV